MHYCLGPDSHVSHNEGKLLILIAGCVTISRWQTFIRRGWEAVVAS
jgi:hypothetical protein